jgi:hypothetical protein
MREHTLVNETQGTAEKVSISLQLYWRRLPFSLVSLVVMPSTSHGMK